MQTNQQAVAARPGTRIGRRSITRQNADRLRRPARVMIRGGRPPDAHHGEPKARKGCARLMTTNDNKWRKVTKAPEPGIQVARPGRVPATGSRAFAAHKILIPTPARAGGPRDASVVRSGLSFGRARA